RMSSRRRKTILPTCWTTSREACGASRRALTLLFMQPCGRHTRWAKAMTRETGMSAETTRNLIRSYLDAFNAGDHEAMLALVDEDVAHDINQGGREIGKDKLRWFLA